jgi:hypothetical protein
MIRCSNCKMLGAAMAWRQGQSYSEDLRGRVLAAGPRRRGTAGSAAGSFGSPRTRHGAAVAPLRACIPSRFRRRGFTNATATDDLARSPARPSARLGISCARRSTDLDAGNGRPASGRASRWRGTPAWPRRCCRCAPRRCPTRSVRRSHRARPRSPVAARAVRPGHAVRPASGRRSRRATAHRAVSRCTCPAPPRAMRSSD